MLANLLEKILVYFHQLTNSYGFSIILLSLAVTIIMVPLYWFAEILQQKERDRKSAMQSGLDEINDLKNKQEKYYYTKELYRQHNYKAYYALTGLVGLCNSSPVFYRSILDAIRTRTSSRNPLRSNQGFVSPG